jgi:MFS family permease
MDYAGPEQDGRRPAKICYNSEQMMNASLKPRQYYGYTVLIACVIINMCIWGVFFSVGVFFKPMLNDLGWSRAITSGPISLSWVVSGLLGITLGGLNDRFGPRLVVMICGVLFGAGCLLMSQISATWQIYLYYGILIGAGLSLPVPIMSTVSRWFVKRRTVMTGVLMLGSGVGGLFMPPVANWMILNYGWRTSYVALGGFFLVVILVAAQFLKRDPSLINQAPDGAPLESGGTLEKRSGANARGLTLREAMRTNQFWLIVALFFFFSMNVNTLMVHMVPHITDLGISATIAATILMTSNGAGIVGRIGLGGFGDRLGNKRIFLVTFILLAVAFFGLICISGVWLLFLFIIIFGVGYGAGLTQESPMVANMFGLKAHGLILGAASLGHTLGAASGTLLAGYLFDISGNYQLTFIICGISSIIGLALVLALRPVKAAAEG